MIVNYNHVENKIKKRFLDICEHSLGAVVLKETVYSIDISFCAEFVAMKQGIDALRCFRHKLMIMGIPIPVPLYIYGHNM